MKKAIAIAALGVAGLLAGCSVPPTDPGPTTTTQPEVQVQTCPPLC